MPAEDGKYQLVVTSKKTGEDGEISISVSGDSKLAKVLITTRQSRRGQIMPGRLRRRRMPLSTLMARKIERSSNTISDAIDGITLDLREVSEKILTTHQN